MWLLVISIYAALKWLTWRRTVSAHTPWALQAGYLLLWPGLDADAFLRPSTGSRQALRPQPEEWILAFGEMLLGFAFFWAASFVPENQDILKGWLGLAAVIFLLHFGLFHVLSCCWRQLGRQAAPLMNWPLLSKSVSEFWGRRWNRAFRDVAHRFLFRPLLPRFGAEVALVLVFALSGLIHDLVISVPAQGDYGRPTLFFLIQALAILVERSRPGRSLGLGDGWQGRLFTALVLIGPAGLLFHATFLRNVMVPFLAALGVHS